MTSQLYIYHISQYEATGWDTYSDAVVVAVDEEAARNTVPDTYISFEDSQGAWASSPDKVTATLIGTAENNEEPRVVCASFRAG